jgi:hypothetical protein
MGKVVMIRPTRRRLVAAIGGAGVVVSGLVVVPALLADSASVSRGDIHPFAAGAALDLGGRAQMVRTADGKTIVTVRVAGLAPNTSYGAHVHQAPCGTGDADGHYKFDPAGPSAPPNEIWPSFTTNDAGVGSGIAVADGTAGPNAVSVVVHAPGGAKIACADLA